MADSYWKLLEQGNKQFIKDKKYIKQREDSIARPKPFCIVLSCADSRVPPEIIFKQGLGKIFTIRTAGHVVDDLVIQSIEYAMTLFDAKILVIMGHSDCIAVKGALLKIQEDNKETEFDVVLNPIVSAIKSAEIDINSEDALSYAIKANICYCAKKILEISKVIHKAVLTNKLELKTAKYDVKSGNIELS